MVAISVIVRITVHVASVIVELVTTGMVANAVVVCIAVDIASVEELLSSDVALAVIVRIAVVGITAVGV